MKGWTDCPESLPAFFAPYCVTFSGEDAPPSLQERFHALGGQGEPVAFNVNDAANSGGTDHAGVTLLLIEDSRRSQFDVMRLWMREWTPQEGILCAQAMQGANFHGQHGRPWIAHKGNLHLTVLLPCDLDARNAPAINALPTIAVCRALETVLATKSRNRVCPHTARTARIKWVNDVLLQGGKVSGSIAAGEIERGRLTALTIGTGINVLVCPEVVRSPSVPGVACLAEVMGGERLPSPGEVMMEWLTSLMFWWELSAPKGWVDAYRERSEIIGRRIRVWSGRDEKNPPGVSGGISEGLVTGISDDVELILEGSDRPVRRGQIEFID